MPPAQRINDLTAQLFRAEDPAVVETVAAMLHMAIDQYVQSVAAQSPRAIQLTPVVTKSAA